MPSSALDMSQKKEISCSIQLYRSMFYKQIHEVSSALVVLLSGSDEQWRLSDKSDGTVNQQWSTKSNGDSQSNSDGYNQPTVMTIASQERWW